VGESPIMVDAGGRGPPLLLSAACYETPPQQQPPVCSFTAEEFSQNCNTQRERKRPRENDAAAFREVNKNI